MRWNVEHNVHQQVCQSEPSGAEESGCFTEFTSPVIKIQTHNPKLRNRAYMLSPQQSCGGI